ncbi:MAG: T9SS C-terminal target domain-containing protein, partial [Bacteroidetes bacterium]
NQSGGNYITRNACDYSQNEKMVYAFDQSGDDPNYYGIALLSRQEMRARAATSASPLPFSTAGKYQSLTTAPSPASSSAGTSNGGTDIMHFISGGPVTIDTASVDTFAFALIGAASLPVLSQHLSAAQKAYYCYVEGKSPQLSFLISDTLIKAGQQVQFLDPNVSATGWQWSFGDGSSDTLRNPMHVFGSAGSYVVTLAVSDGYCTSKFTRTLRVQSGVGIEEPSAARFRVYPNPATAFVRIEAPEGLKGTMRCVLHNLMGQSLRQTEELGASALMSLEGLAPGLYLLEIEARGLREYHPLVVE